jgi:hypothetical protein
MEPVEPRPRPFAEQKALVCRPCCPVCGGTLLEMRSQMRCSRCNLVVCEGCEGGEPVAAADGY